MKTPHLIVTAILLQVLGSANEDALGAADGKDKPNPQTPDARFAIPSPVPDYVTRTGKLYEDRIRVIHPSALPAEIPCRRVQVGPANGLQTERAAALDRRTGDVELPHARRIARSVRTVPWPNTWSCTARKTKAKHGPRSTCRGVYGREPYLNVFSGDIMLATGHVLSADVNNPTKKVACVIHRSTDGG